MALVVKPKTPAPATTVTDGTYRAILTNVKQFANNYGERIGFEFTIIGGQFDGQKVMRSTASQLTRQSKLTEIIEGITGQRLADQELSSGVDLEALPGTVCSILVLQSKSKAGTVYSNVERVFQ
ncbi:hypothetical protein H0A71_23225 [Alcaligenaceae bacterium]|nr:hypothetical protein [Alcaligenaceae bacterium]